MKFKDTDLRPNVPRPVPIVGCASDARWRNVAGDGRGLQPKGHKIIVDSTRVHESHHSLEYSREAEEKP